jgi:hypothetical protein
MDDPVMRPPEAVIRKDFVGIGNEVPVSKEQKLDQTDDIAIRRLDLAAFGRNYVSHIDIFLGKRYKIIRPAAISLRSTLPDNG